MLQQIEHEIAKVLADTIKFRHVRHQNPELTWQEKSTATAIAAELKKIDGIVVQEGVGKLGVVGLLQGKHKGPTIGLRADMDALPIHEATGKAYASQNAGVHHACGHDGHMANLLGSARVLAKLRDELHGTVKFIFQPAEEGGAGADVMIKDGVLKDPKVDMIFGLHGWPQAKIGVVGTRPGPLLASTVEFTIEVTGKGGHAAMPHLAIDPILISAQIILNAQSIVSRRCDPHDPVVLSITTISAGKATNVIPPKVTMTGTLRTIHAATRGACLEQLTEIAAGTARANGGGAEVTFKIGYPVTNNHPKAVEYVFETATKVLGADHTELAEFPTMGGEDFAYYLEKVPGAFFFVGLDEGAGYPSLHHPAFDFNDKALHNGMRMFVHLALNAHTTAHHTWETPNA